MLLKLAPSNAEIETEWNFKDDKEEIETEWNFKDDKEEYNVERILDSQRNRQKTEYLVKWLGYDEEENLWEPTKNFSPAMNQKLVDYY